NPVCQHGKTPNKMSPRPMTGCAGRSFRPILGPCVVIGGAAAMSVQLAREPLAQQAGAVKVAPMSIHIGAEVSGVDLSRPLPPEHVSAIRAALVRWKVIFFRNQPLDHRRHIAFARQFGETTAGHVVYGSDGEYP